MAVEAFPDVMKAVLDRIRAHAGVQELAGAAPNTRVSAVLSPDWTGMPTFAVVVHRVAGPGPDDDSDLAFQNLQIDCYAPPGRAGTSGPRESYRLWTQVHVALCPRSRYAGRGFTLAHTRVYNIWQTEAPIYLPTESGWPRTVTQYSAMYGMDYAP